MQRRENLERMLRSFSLCRTECLNFGFEEYAVGYFGTPAANVAMPFGLKVETAGFGSGATSLIEGEYRCHSAGKLDDYVSKPLQWDFRSPSNNSGVVSSALRAGLALSNGINASDWLDLIKEPLERSLSNPEIAPLADYFKRIGGLSNTGDRIALNRQRAANALATLNYDTAMSVGDE